MLKKHQVKKFRDLYFVKTGKNLTTSEATREAIVFYKLMELLFKKSGSDFVPKIVIK